MTVQRVLYVQCDSCGDNLMGESEDARTVAQAREDARWFGYHRTRDGRDICGPCWDRGKR